jgi:hypothetical protein
MDRRAALQLLLGSAAALAQDAPDYVCPMDPDVRSPKPGACSRCGMKLVLGIPDGLEYPLELTTNPRALRAGEKVEMVFRVMDPKSGKLVTKFEIVHDKLFHLFIVSQDLQHFAHVHPVLDAGSVFRFSWTFPKPGLYRILGDFYPSGATPQLIARTLIVPGGQLAVPKLAPELGPSHCENMDVELAMEPAQPLAGQKTLLFFKLKPADGLEKYLAAWGHMLAASDDLIDMIHSHPFLADGGPQEQFNLIFPRARTYRIWVQFQRQGVVNTAAFNVPVTELR